MKAACLLVVLIATALAQIHPRPQISEVFESPLLVEYQAGGTSEWGEGYMAMNQPQGKGYERIMVDGYNKGDYVHIERYDLGHSYEIFRNDTCDDRSLEGKMPAFWSWVQSATYKGRETIRARELDIWTFEVGYAIMTLGVFYQTPNIPAFYRRTTPTTNYTVDFLRFVTAPPSNNVFNVPNRCNNKELQRPQQKLVGCEQRATMLARAQVWVNNKVPYNQDATYMGYREDCSGYVSMSWETAKPGYTTETLITITDAISKSQLMPGDALDCAVEHVVLFGGWANAEKTEYTAYEETRPGEGTVKRVTPYPYWYNTGCFEPRKYKSVC